MPEEVTQGQIEETQGEGQLPAEVPAAEEPQEEGLPEDAPERTRKQFEKLKEHNRQLAEENKQLKTGAPRPPSLLETYVSGQGLAGQLPVIPAPPQFIAPVAPPAPAAAQPPRGSELYDQDGYVNARELDRRLLSVEEAERRAKKAQEDAQAALERIARFEADTQARELYQQFPELDPSHKDFNQEFYEEVEQEMLTQLVKTGKQDAVSAAKKKSRYFSKTDESTLQQRQNIEQRSQASATPRATGNARSLNGTDYDELRRRSLRSDDAMEERIRRSGI